MNCNLSKAAEKVRNSTTREGAPKFTGAVRYKVIGSIEGFDPKSPDSPAMRIPVRHALGTEDKQTAQRLVEKIDSAYVSGPDSPLWPELKGALPSSTFKFFADRIRYQDREAQAPSRATARPTWTVLCQIFEQEMASQVARYLHGESKKAIAPRTEKLYKQVMRRFEAFLQDSDPFLDDIKQAAIERYRAERREKLSGNGGSIAIDMAVLHRIFKFAVDREIMGKNPIVSKDETKPGENPKTPARPLDADQLQGLRDAARDDMLAYLLLRWTGLRGSDAVNLTWAGVLFDSGTNGEIKIMTQKGRRRQKQAEIPMSTELRNALLDAKKAQAGGPSDFVLWNPYTHKPYSKGDASINDAGRKKLYERIKEMGNRVKDASGKAAPIDVTPHDFRDTFICDMLARGNSIFYVAKMVADTVKTLEDKYAQFIPAAKDAAQHTMDHGIGIEERAKLNQQRGQKIVAMPGRA